MNLAENLTSNPYALVGLAIVVVAVLLVLQLVQKKKEIALDPEQWIPFKLEAVEHLSHDVRSLRFALQSPNHILGLPIGQHISLKYTDDNGKLVQRSYTPISSDVDRGYVQFAIKVYFKDVHPKFPEGGKMSQHLNDLKIGDSVLMKGPKGHLTYEGKGSFSITRSRVTSKVSVRRVGMIAGGTGITPMLQVIRAVLRDPKDTTEMFLIFANQTEQDIFLRHELEGIPKNRLHLWYTVDRPTAGWKYSSGFVNTAMCKDHLPPPAEDTLILLCGPPPMIKFACEPALKELGFQEHQWYAF